MDLLSLAKKNIPVFIMVTTCRTYGPDRLTCCSSAHPTWLRGAVVLLSTWCCACPVLLQEVQLLHPAPNAPERRGLENHQA